MKNISDFTKNAGKSLAFALLSGTNAYFLSTGTPDPILTATAEIIALGMSGKYYYDTVKSYLKFREIKQETQ